MPPAVERPLAQHRAKTVFLRVPAAVWPMVSTGRISEFRQAVGNAPQLWTVPLPTLAVAYRRQLSVARYDYRLMLLEAIRREALGTIDQEGLAAAGYTGSDAKARFRRDWTIHEKKRFEPLRTVFVYTVRTVQPGDSEVVGLALVEHLYGEHIAQDAHHRPRTIQAHPRADQAVAARGR